MSELISIIVPIYNMAAYLPRSINSIFDQTYTNIEVIAVDDGSGDETWKVLQALAKEDSRLRIIHQENKGVTRARLAGIQAAKGEWIGFMDGDDQIEPDMYERLLENAIQYHADISHCGYKMIFPDRTYFYYNTGRLVQQDNQTGLKDLIEGVFIEPGLCVKLFRRSLFDNLLNNRLMDTTIRNTEDLLMNFYLFREAENSIYEDFCPYLYMVRKGSAATSVINEHKIRDPLRVLRIIEKETGDNNVLQKSVKQRIAGRLISMATIRSRKKADWIRRCRRQARRELRKMLPQVLRGPFSRRTKILTVWVSLSPWSYEMVHALYAKVRGLDKKFEVS